MAVRQQVFHARSLLGIDTRCPTDHQIFGLYSTYSVCTLPTLLHVHSASVCSHVLQRSLSICLYSIAASIGRSCRMKSERATCPFKKCAGSFQCNTGAAYNHFLTHYSSGACKNSGLEHECTQNVCVRAKAAEYIDCYSYCKEKSLVFLITLITKIILILITRITLITLIDVGGRPVQLHSGVANNPNNPNRCC